jgi:hypothetical protein
MNSTARNVELGKSLQLQGGFGLFEMLFGLAFIGFALTLILKLGPHYVDDYGVKAALQELHTDLAGKSAAEITREDINSNLSQNFQVSLIPDEILKSVETVREGGKLLVSINYETRQPLIANIDVVMRFKHEMDLADPTSKAQ